MSESATLTALVHGKQTAVSFRHLSSVLNVPTRKAQNLLREFAASDSTVTTLWCVTDPDPKTGILRTSLTTLPPANVKKQIWAVGPPSAGNALSKQAIWLVSDAAHDRALVSQPSHVQNELRDGRWNRITSQTSAWDAQLDPRLGGDERLASGCANPSSARFNSSSLLASIKAKAKGKKAKAKGFKGGAFRPSSGASASLFALKPLGADAVKKMQNSSSKQEKEKDNCLLGEKSESALSKCKEEKANRSKPEAKNRKRRIPAKKAPKVVDDESDGEDRSVSEDLEAEDDEEQKCKRELEREAAEKEKADAERAALEQECRDLHRNDADEEPESPELKELDDNHGSNHEAVSPVPRPEELGSSPDSGKRSFWQTFGDGPNGTKRVRKEFEENVEEDGYIVTRRVVKIFDEHGNEVKDSDAEKALPKIKDAVDGTHLEGKTDNPLRPSRQKSRKEKLSPSGLKKDKTKDSKRPILKLGSTTKKTPKKKIKGNIMSYFGKKT